MDEGADRVPGPLLFLGSEQVEPMGCDEALLERADGKVLVLPTGAAYERPERSVAVAVARFGPLGATVQTCMVLARADAERPEHADTVASARFIYLCGGSPLHLRSVLKDSQVLQALLSAWRSGAVVVGASGAATVLSDPMVDPRGGAFTVGLGLVRDVAVVPDDPTEVGAQLRRTLALSPRGCALVALGRSAALLREPDGTWTREGSGELTVFADGAPIGLDGLAGKSLHPSVEHPSSLSRPR